MAEDNWLLGIPFLGSEKKKDKHPPGCRCEKCWKERR